MTQKQMKRIVGLFLLFFLFFSYSEEYLLTSTQGYFNGIEWADGSVLDFSVLPTPFSIGSEGIDSTFLYSDTTKDDTIFPEIDGLGVLDYTASSSALLTSLQRFSTSIINKKLALNTYDKTRPFLPYLFEYRFRNMKGLGKIDYVFFAAPTYSNASHASAKFRLNYERDGQPKYRLMEGQFAKLEDASWVLEAFDFIGWEVNASSN